MLLGVLILLLPATAMADTLRERYQTEWEYCWDKKDCDPGRNIVKWGLKDGKKTEKAPRTKVNESLKTLRRLSGKVVVYIPPPSTYTQYGIETGQSIPSSTGGSLPSEATAQCESGGSYTAQNGPYYGKWQIDVPLHYGSGGECSDLDTSPAGQDACAIRLSDNPGDPWPNC
jgi:hypothetical protein